MQLHLGQDEVCIPMGETWLDNGKCDWWKRKFLFGEVTKVLTLANDQKGEETGIGDAV